MVGFFTISNEIYESFKKTKENITNPVLSEKIICDVKLDDVNL